MKTTLRSIAVGLALTFGYAYSQDFQSLSYIDARSRSTYSVVATPLTTIRSLFGTKVNGLLQGFAGTSLDSGRMVAGLALTFDFKVAANVSLTLGPGAWLENRRVRSAGLLAGLSVKF